MKKAGLTFLLLPAVVLATAGMNAFQADSIPGARATQSRSTGTLRLTASLSGKNIFVSEGDSSLIEYPVTIGLDEHPTPTGTFRIRKIVWNPRWVPPAEKWAKNKTAKAPGDKDNPMKVVKIFFKEPDYYIHGTDNLEKLGASGSHGCLRMDPADAAEVAKLIMEHGGEPRAENWFLRVLHSRREERVVILRKPVLLTITE